MNNDNNNANAMTHAAANLQIMLQTNTDVLVAMHKMMVEVSQETTRKIESLRDDIRDIKLNLQKNDNTLKEEAGQWRHHTEMLLKEQGERHLQDTARLTDMLMKLALGAAHQIQMPPISAAVHPVQAVAVSAAAPMPAPIAPPPAPPQVRAPAQQQPAQVLPQPTITMTTTLAKKEEPAGFKMAATALPEPATTGASAVLPPPPASKEFSFKQKEEPAGFKMTTTTAPALPTPVPPTTTVAVPPTAPKEFSFKTNTATSFADLAKKSESGVGGTSLFGGGGTGGGGSLFGGGFGGSKPQFGTGTTIASPGTGVTNGGGKPQFGISPFATGKIFSSPQLSLNASARSSVKGAGDDSGRAEDESDKEEDKPEDYTPDAHYEPVIELPPEVEVVSGEEAEEVTFQARCKLYRFDRDAKENKERGLGEIKILKNPSTQKYRCVMRREKVLKLCANFPVHTDLKMHQRDGMPTVYTWACKDFSEDQFNGEDETFSARFKDVGIADEFNEQMSKAIEEMKQQQ